MTLNKPLQALSQLGSFLTLYTSSSNQQLSGFEKEQAQKLDLALSLSLLHNSWYTKEDLLWTLKQWGKTLQDLQAQTKKDSVQASVRKTIALLYSEHTPLAQLHDLLCILITGHQAIIQHDVRKNPLLPALADFLTATPFFSKESVVFTDKKLPHFDAAIVSGFKNREYFKSYLAQKPHLIRKPKASVAVLSGEESEEELHLLGEDLFRYYGMGSHSVSKLLVPQDYDFSSFFKGIYHWNPIIHFHKYANNYDYNKAVYLMSDFKILDNGFLVLKEDSHFHSPIACLFYEYYPTPEHLDRLLTRNKEKIQKVVSVKGEWGTRFGAAWLPKLNVHPEANHTLSFLSSLS